MLDVKLNFINRSNDLNNSQIVIFQKNVATHFDELVVAWTVIQNCGVGDIHPFTYPTAMTVGASDSWGNYTPQLAAQNGQLLHMTKNGSGDVLAYAGPSTSSTEVQLRNDLQTGAISAYIYKNGRLLATKTSLAPEQKAVFTFKPTIWIGAVSQITEGEVMNPAIVQEINTELSLMNLASADIVMTGGGSGASSTAFEFNLENVVMAQ